MCEDTDMENTRSQFPNHRAECPSTVSRYAEHCAYCTETDHIQNDIPEFIAAVKELGQGGQVRFRPQMGGTFVLYRYDRNSPTGVTSETTLKMTKEATRALDGAGIRQSASQTL
jgi:hypothetical protein